MVEAYIQRIHETFDGNVLAHDIHPDPPVRGIYGWASIPLRADAVTTRAKPFYMHGERHEA